MAITVNWFGWHCKPFLDAGIKGNMSYIFRARHVSRMKYLRTTYGGKVVGFIVWLTSGSGEIFSLLQQIGLFFNYFLSVQFQSFT